MKKWKMRIIKTDRNETRIHTSTGLISIFYKNQEGLQVAYQFAKANLTERVANTIKEAYRKAKLQGA